MPSTKLNISVIKAQHFAFWYLPATAVLPVYSPFPEYNRRTGLTSAFVSSLTLPLFAKLKKSQNRPQKSINAMKTSSSMSIKFISLCFFFLAAMFTSVLEAREIPTISVQKLFLKFSTKQTSCIVDIRPSEYYHDPGHIPGSINLPPEKIDNPATTLPKCQLQPVYIICQRGYKSHKAAKKLSRYGLSTIIVEGGINAWLKKGYPIVKTSQTD